MTWRQKRDQSCEAFHQQIYHFFQRKICGARQQLFNQFQANLRVGKWTLWLQSKKHHSSTCVAFGPPNPFLTHWFRRIPINRKGKQNLPQEKPTVFNRTSPFCNWVAAVAHKRSGCVMFSASCGVTKQNWHTSRMLSTRILLKTGTNIFNWTACSCALL